MNYIFHAALLEHYTDLLAVTTDREMKQHREREVVYHQQQYERLAKEAGLKQNDKK